MLWPSKRPRLEQAEISFTAVVYDYDSSACSRGLQAAEALGEQTDRVLKTLLALIDGHPVSVIAPSDWNVSMKRLAATFCGKSAQMMPPVDAERISGYKIGGISPFGQLRQLPTVVDAPALHHPLVYVNGGQRGLSAKTQEAIWTATQPHTTQTAQAILCSIAANRWSRSWRTPALGSRAVHPRGSRFAISKVSLSIIIPGSRVVPRGDAGELCGPH